MPENHLLLFRSVVSWVQQWHKWPCLQVISLQVVH